jgi:hypothetical protein
MTEYPSRRGTLALLAGVPLAASGAAMAQPGESAGPRRAGFQANVRDFGAVGDGVHDDRPAFLAAIASVSVNGWEVAGRPAYSGGARIRVPAGAYFLSDSIDLKRTVIIEGETGGMAGGQATVLRFAPNCHGFIIEAWNTIGGDRVESAATGAGDGTILQNLAIISLGGRTGHGVFARARFIGRELNISKFPGDGYHVVAGVGAGGATEGNANNFQILGGRVEQCGGDGVHVAGADANAGLIQGVDSSHNGGWGFYDKSFLGNTYVACHTGENRTGGYCSVDPNARNVYLGCYSESDQKPSQIASPAMVIGGLHAAGVIGSGTVISGVDGALLSAGGFRSEKGNFLVQMGGGPGQVLSLVDPKAAPLGWRMTVSPGNDLRFDYGNLDNGVSYTITGPETKQSFGRAGGVPNVLSVPQLGLGSGSSARLLTYGEGAPTSGSHARGERIYYSSPSAGGREGVVCVASGTPGTWKEFGAIDR